jgi:hypothetical protein
MKVMLRGRGLWAAVTIGPSNEQEDPPGDGGDCQGSPAGAGDATGRVGANTGLHLCQCEAGAVPRGGNGPSILY